MYKEIKKIYQTNLLSKSTCILLPMSHFMTKKTKKTGIMGFFSFCNIALVSFPVRFLKVELLVHIHRVTGTAYKMFQRKRVGVDLSQQHEQTTFRLVRKEK